ncbi:MAG: helix-turn-helix transcriptional regulator [Bacilli bacterium]|nr:helix-turn-helix transcriptional regulator [Bacilli bacterium]
MDKFKFGEYIYNKRKSLGLTQEELGRKVGVTNKAVSKWEVGETCPDISMLAPLSKALGVTIDELLTYTDKEKVETTKKKSNLLLILIIIALSIIEITTLVFLIISLTNSEFKEIEITNENIKEVIEINPSSRIEVDGETLVIGTTYSLNDSYVIEEEIKFTVVYKYQYYYYLKDDTIGVVTYYNRFYDVILNKENTSVSLDILLEPKFDITNFKGFNKVEISYIVLNAEGKILRMGDIS